MGIPIPLIPAEVISEILSHLGKNDLLKCRLVSQSWNILSLKILRNSKYGHAHELTEDNIQKFLEFSNGRREEWILPFHLNFGRCVYDESADYRGHPNYIQQLQTIFGEKCVVGLTLTHHFSRSLKAVNELISILTLIAPSLTHLDLSDFHIQYNNEEKKIKLQEMIGMTQLNFPNLSKLKSCPPPTYWNGHHLNHNPGNEIHAFLMKNSENLKELEVISRYDLLGIHNHIGNLRKLKIVKGLKDLEIILKPIQICPTPVLKDLSLTCSIGMSVRDHQILYEFLASFSTSLQSLMIEFEEIPTNPFPRLSCLKFLRIQISTPSGTRENSARRLVDLKKLNLNSEAFPVLESMDISTKIYFDVNCGPDDSDDWILETVKNLRVRVTDSVFNARAMNQHDYEEEDEYWKIESKVSAKDYVDHLQQLFPNVTSLTLVNESDWYENAENLNQLLIAFIQSDGAPKIKELEIQNYEKNYLGHILHGLDDPDKQPLIIIKNMTLNVQFLNSIKKAFQEFSGGSELKVNKQMKNRDGVENTVVTCKAQNIHIKMTGLEKIRMGISEEFNDDFGESESVIEHARHQNDLFLSSLPKNFPLLRQIDISQQMFGDDKEFCKQQIIRVQEKYPDLIINTTC